MRPLFWIAAIASAGLVARLVSKEASRLPRGLSLHADEGRDDRAIGLATERGSPNQAERLRARGLGAAPLPTAATPDEQGSIPGLPDFTRGA
ncbi:MAG TPA: hypothetical protein H9903_20095 [Candidatus Aquabacterium excrementipullorum]|nr:hypothetical protein [Candidatus Aquabacterium excrementipullorum]